ncbi:MAG: FAD-binding domain-containing protein, partial [Planctomycetota bacterium]|nr:FAD-binding domain-containing protein [Planctomycetota bacterium]
RDARVAAWCREREIPWHERPQTGVVRGLASRDGWSKQWQARMDMPIVPEPAAIRPVAGIPPGRRREPQELDLPPSTKHGAQRGGESLAHELLQSFLDRRGQEYRRDMSSPLTAWDGCSRLSPHLAFGSISVRQVHQALEARRRELRTLRAMGAAVEAPWLQSLSSFAGRLRWHCHFMQKFEDEPRIEFENMSRAYDGLREGSFDAERFAAWAAGRTGYPLIDACMRCLHETGWINFRMRAMLVSFASYHLWLPWWPTAVYLARHFLDFEAGIHFSQVQMQSGVTGINTVRIYSPIKQAKDQDPGGTFIRQWVPELRDVPTAYIAEPHTMPLDVQVSSGCRIGRDYPKPIVEHGPAYAEARRRMAAARRRPEARAEAKEVYRKHGSRRRPQRRRAVGG